MFQYIRRAAEIFNRPKNFEDISDLDDFLTESTASTRTIILKFSHAAVAKKLQKHWKSLRTIDDTKCCRAPSVYGLKIKIALPDQAGIFLRHNINIT